jgi:hypothetical protein
LAGRLTEFWGVIGILRALAAYFTPIIFSYSSGLRSPDS